MDFVSLCNSITHKVIEQETYSNPQKMWQVLHSRTQKFKTGVGNLSLVMGQKQNLQGMAGRTNFPPVISFSLLLMMFLKLGNLWNFNQIHSLFSQFITENPE